MSRHQIRKKSSLSVIEIIVIPLCLLTMNVYSDTDTIYGETELVPKENSTQELEHDYKDHSDNDDNDEDEPGFFESCLVDILSEVFKFVFIEPVKTFFRSDITVNTFSLKPLRWGAGTSISDFSLYPKSSFIYSVKLNGDLLYAPNEYIAFREHLGLHMSPVAALLSDFERDVYVNSKLVGQIKDKSETYHIVSIPLLTELMIRPAGNSFYFTFGGGPGFVTEKFYGKREFSYLDTIENITIRHSQWVPFISVGIGKLVDFEKIFGAFEIRYSLGFNRNSRKESVPGDNTRYVHGFTLIQYQLFL